MFRTKWRSAVRSLDQKADGVTDTQINDEIIKKDLDITFIEYADQELVKMKNDAMIQGMNGMLSLDS